MRIRDLSLRYKIPLRVIGLVLVTAFTITAALLAREYDEVRNDLLRNAATMGRVLAANLATPIAQDDVWRAYEIIRSAGPDRPGSAEDAEIVMLLDAEGRVFVSTRPDRFPMLVRPGGIDPEFNAVIGAIEAMAGLQPMPVEPPESDRIYMVTPVESDGMVLGRLVAGYSKSLLLPRFHGLMWRALWVTVAVLALLLPISWYWGYRTGVPLIELADAMSRIVPNVPERLEFRPYDSGDEIGRLGSAFRGMVGELRKKERLETEMVKSERLAAVGQLAAGIAHEINNPLGGMLNAISTLKRHGNPEVAALLVAAREPCGHCDLPTRIALGGKTLSLLERGLVQIKETVSALLIEARIGSHPLSHEDIEDTRTLVTPEVSRKHAVLSWENALEAPVSLPSTLVRQVLINLLLNAVQAVEDRGHISCRVRVERACLVIEVANDGRHIPAERMEVLFEPFAGTDAGRRGLGLWVTYQIVRQLGGEITARSEAGLTRFGVRLPLRS
jgi:two-component system, NtrC family, sensor kinase